MICFGCLQGHESNEHLHLIACRFVQVGWNPNAASKARNGRFRLCPDNWFTRALRRALIHRAKLAKSTTDPPWPPEVKQLGCPEPAHCGAACEPACATSSGMVGNYCCWWQRRFCGQASHLQHKSKFKPVPDATLQMPSEKHGIKNLPLTALPSGRSRYVIWKRPQRFGAVQPGKS